MKTALFVDFEDSFSFNIVQELRTIGYQVSTVRWQDLNSDFDHDLIVLGPGPGHPDEYSEIFPIVQALLSGKRHILGICLGHQIIWSLKGFEIVRSKKPLHGQKVQLKLDEDWQRWLGRSKRIWVQRYNSLMVRMDQLPIGVKGLIIEGELYMSRFENVVTYQFHPESLGTKCRQSFFRPIYLDTL